MTPFRRRVLFIGILGAAGAAAGGYAYRQRTSPAYALALAAQALRAHDRTAFERRVDVDQLTSSAVDELMSHFASTALAEKIGEGAAQAMGIAVGLKLMESYKPALVSTARVNLLSAVEKGATENLFAAPESETGKPHFGHLAQSAIGQPPRFVKLGRIRQSGPLATAELILHDSVLNAPLTLRLRMERGADGWRVVRIDNAREYLDQTSRLQRERIAEHNREIGRRLSAAVQVGEPELRLVPGEYGGELMQVVVPITNTGRDTISRVTLVLESLGEVLDAEDAKPRSVLYLAPGASALAMTGMVQRDISIPWHGKVWLGMLKARVQSADLFRHGGMEYVDELADWQEYMAWRDEHHSAQSPAPAASTARS